MEIERKWMVEDWPGGDLPLLYTEFQQQGYVHADVPIVRIRREERIPAENSLPENGSAGSSLSGNESAGNSLSGSGQSTVRYVLCLKSAGRLAREEIELDIPEETFEQICGVIGHPLIRKTRRTYQLADGKHLEVNLVDDGLPTRFMYAEIEYDSIAHATDWDPACAGLEDYLTEDVTALPGQSMSAYWITTRLQPASESSVGTGRL